jgi:arylsulfatase A-like enzyme
MTDDEPRNVVVVVFDTVRKDRLTPYGHDRPTTPGLADFADEATVFENAVSQAPWTLPVHASLFTGTYPSEHGATQESPYLEGGTTLAEALSDRGYDTACYTSNAWITPYTGMTRGFDDVDNFFSALPGDVLSGPLARIWRALNDNPTLRRIADRLVELGNVVHEYTASGADAESKSPRAVDRALDFVDDSDGPFFTFLNLMDAHLPLHPPEPLREEFAPNADPASICQNSKEYNCGARAIDDDEWADIRGLYDAAIRHADDQVARLFDGLRERDEWDDTTVVVCADHGELHGEHDLYGHEFCLYDPLVNVPLLVKHPALDAGRRMDTVELLDCYHTLRDDAGALSESGGSASSGASGAVDTERSLLRDAYRSFDGGSDAFVEYDRPVVELNQLETKAAAAGIDLPAESRFYSRMRAVRRPDAKYIAHERIPDECYDLAADPGETTPLDGSDECDDLATTLDAFADRVGSDWTGDGGADGGSGAEGDGDDPLGDMDEQTVDRLRDLGYVE